jgi:hypothetical protein
MQWTSFFEAKAEHSEAGVSAFFPFEKSFNVSIMNSERSSRDISYASSSKSGSFFEAEPKPYKFPSFAVSANKQLYRRLYIKARLALNK